MVTGPFINASAVLVGGVLGALLSQRLPERIRTAMTSIFGLASLGIGILLVIKCANLPVMVLSNDGSSMRGKIDDAARALLRDAIDLLTTPVNEVDRSDRLNWIDPTKVVDSNPGLKLMTFSSEQAPTESDIVLGIDSNEMVDSLMILQTSPDEEGHAALPYARLKKTGFYQDVKRRIVGKVSSDITPINAIIDRVEQAENLSKAQKVETVDRLSSSGDDELIL